MCGEDASERPRNYWENKRCEDCNDEVYKYRTVYYCVSCEDCCCDDCAQEISSAPYLRLEKIMGNATTTKLIGFTTWFRTALTGSRLRPALTIAAWIWRSRNQRSSDVSRELTLSSTMFAIKRADTSGQDHSILRYISLRLERQHANSKTCDSFEPRSLHQDDPHL